MTILDGHCAEIGRDPRTIHRTAVALLFMSEDTAWLERMRARPMQQPAIIGTIEEVRETVAAYEQAGVDELIVPDFTLGTGPERLNVLDAFIRDVAGR